MIENKIESMSNIKRTKVLNVPGYEIYCTRLADAILDIYFPTAKSELYEILSNFKVREDYVIRGGGGKSLITQELESLMNASDWEKRKIETYLHIGKKKEERVIPRISHEIDHFKRFEHGNIGLEIEWNNKDPFFDRDLQQFRWGHEIEEQAIGIIITRGISLQLELENVFVRALTALEPFNMELLDATFKFSQKARATVKQVVEKMGRQGISQIAREVFKSKYGTSTTHMQKLLEHVDRGAGDPCPLILIGIEKERLTTVGHTSQADAQIPNDLTEMEDGEEEEDYN